jgi:hypothetical protein
MVANFLTKNVPKEKHMYHMQILRVSFWGNVKYEVIYCPSNIDMESEVTNKIHGNKSHLHVYKYLDHLLINKQLAYMFICLFIFPYVTLLCFSCWVEA